MAAVRTVSWRLKVEGDEIAVQKLTNVGNRARQAVKDTPGLLSGISAASRELQSDLSGLAGRIGVVGTALTGMGPIGLGVAAVLGTVGLAAHEAFSRTREADEFADGIERMAQRLGLGTAAYQEIIEAAKQFNLDQSEVTSGLSLLRNNMSQFIAGVGGARGISAVFKQLGLSRNDLANAGSFQRQIEMIADALSRVQNVGVRQGLADRLGVTNLLPMLQNGADNFDRMLEAARQSGHVIDQDIVQRGGEANRKFNDLSDTIDKKLKSSFVGLSPAILKAKSLWADFWGVMSDGVQSFLPKSQQTTDFLQRQLATYQGVIAKYQPIVDTAKKPGYFDPGAYLDAVSKVNDATEKVAILQRALTQKWSPMANDGLPNGIPLSAHPWSPKPSVLPPTQAEIDAAKQAQDQMQRDAQAAAEREIQQAQQLYEKRVQFLAQLGVDTQRSAAERVNAENAANVEILRGKQGYYQALLKQANDSADAEIAVIDAQVKAQLAALDKLRDEHAKAGVPFTNYDAAKHEIEQGGDDQRAAVNARRLQDQVGIARDAKGAIGQLVDQINGPLDLALKQVGANGLQTFTETLTGIATGAEDAGDAIGKMVDSIIADMARLVIQRAITAPLAGALDGFISGLVGGHADGGALKGGMMSRINERGGFPETYFTSQGDGYILSSPTSLDNIVNLVRRSGGAGTTVVASPSQPPKVEIYNQGEPLAVSNQQYDSGSNTMKVDLKRQLLDGVRQDIRSGALDSAFGDRFGARPARRRRE